MTWNMTCNILVEKWEIYAQHPQLCRSDDEDLTQMGPQMGPQSEEIRRVGGFTNGLILKLLACLHVSFQDFYTDFDS